jgi:hypothetical protein
MQALVLTASIQVPTNASGVARKDARLRLDDYRQALAFYTSLVGRGLDRIVFAENTGADLSLLRELTAENGTSSSVDFLTFDGNGFPPNYGRCYGEATILDEVMRHKSCSQLPEDTIYWKSTGRYQVKNLQKMMDTMPRGAHLYCDMRRRGGRRWADMRFMSWTRKGYNEFLAGIAPSLREDTRNYRPGEEALFDLLEERFSVSLLEHARSFTREPLIDGIRAFDNKNWSSGRQKIVYYIRSLQRRFLHRVFV